MAIWRALQCCYMEFPWSLLVMEKFLPWNQLFQRCWAFYCCSLLHCFCHSGKSRPLHVLSWLLCYICEFTQETMPFQIYLSIIFPSSFRSRKKISWFRLLLWSSNRNPVEHLALSPHPPHTPLSLLYTCMILWYLEPFSSSSYPYWWYQLIFCNIDPSTTFLA